MGYVDSYRLKMMMIMMLWVLLGQNTGAMQYRVAYFLQTAFFFIYNIYTSLTTGKCSSNIF